MRSAHAPLASLHAAHGRLSTTPQAAWGKLHLLNFGPPDRKEHSHTLKNHDFAPIPRFLVFGAHEAGNNPCWQAGVSQKILMVVL